MFLPESVMLCIQTLENAGFEAYAVGGCVRDALLGLQPHDYDLCTNATPDETARLFSAYSLVRSGEKHGTIGVVMDHEVYEITTFRTEGDYQDSRHPNWVQFVKKLEDDLARRDFTVNAIAYAPDKGYIDPFGGIQDLQNRILRTVGDATLRFSEDALRILRGVRFAVRYRLTPDPATRIAMDQQALLMSQLAVERIFEELCKLLPHVTAQDLLDYASILLAVLPELKPCYGFSQHSCHHLYDVFTHTARAVEAVPPEPAMRWAALLHDCGKPESFVLGPDGQGHFPEHAKLSAQLAEKILLRLKAPTALREQVAFLVGHHMVLFEPDKRLIRRKMGKYGTEAFANLLTLQQADLLATGTASTTDHFANLHRLMEEILAEESCLHIKDLHVDGRDLLALGFAPGPQIGTCLQWLLEQVQDETLKNNHSVLLDAAKTFLLQHI